MRMSEIKCIRRDSAQDGGEEFTATTVPEPTFFMSDNATVARNLFPAQEPPGIVNDSLTVVPLLNLPRINSQSVINSIIYMKL